MILQGFHVSLGIFLVICKIFKKWIS